MYPRRGYAQIQGLSRHKNTFATVTFVELSVAEPPATGLGTVSRSSIDGREETSRPPVGVAWPDRPPRVALIENFALRTRATEKLNDRRIVEPSMDENSKKIRELTEAMHAERDIRIRNRMMAVRGILAGYPTKDAAYFADVDRRTVQLWVARFDEGGIGGLRDAPGRGRPPTRGVRADQETGRQACRQEHAHPQKASELDTR